MQIQHQNSNFSNYLCDAFEHRDGLREKFPNEGSLAAEARTKCIIILDWKQEIARLKKNIYKSRRNVCSNCSLQFILRVLHHEALERSFSTLKVNRVEADYLCCYTCSNFT